MLTNSGVLNWIDALPEVVRNSVLSEMKPLRAPAHTMLYERYASVKGLYRIVSGKIRLYAIAPDGREMTYIVYGQTESFGDLAAIDGQPYPLSADTVTNCELLFLSRQQLSRLRRAHPELETALLEFAVKVARITLNFVEEATIFPLQARIASRLSYLSASARARGESVDDLQIGQKEIGVMVGASRQAVNKILAEFQSKGLIETHYGGIRIKDRKGLHQQSMHFLPPSEPIA
ncbi:Crp/Fnr family transcriptional regulator [Hyphococcus sp.]|uniref:Crp/Fnr family transcriptional regulator n=1 Tax=Hyphococcus sp. TaxID=2038636 RepID=UPI00207FF82A|nr:MAG: CRP-like cAMP-activated global transcriptional regulator [Marinicaulis sp.]